jgi:hypothetical protein
MGYTLMRCKPMVHAYEVHVYGMPLRSTPMRYTLICEENARKMCAHEIHTYEIHACMV